MLKDLTQKPASTIFILQVTRVSFTFTVGALGTKILDCCYFSVREKEVGNSVTETEEMKSVMLSSTPVTLPVLQVLRN